MAHDVGRGDLAGPSRAPAPAPAPAPPADSVSNTRFPARLDTLFSTAAAAAGAAATSEATSTPSSTSRHGSLLGDLPQFRPQSLHLPSPAHHTHAHARLARRWTTSSPRADVNLLRAGGGGGGDRTATTTETVATSTAIAIPVRRRPSALQRVASSIRRLATTQTSHSSGSGSRAAADNDEEDWSVFGELMVAHDAAMSQPLAPPLSPLSSSSRSLSSSLRARRSDAGEGFVPNLRVLVSTPVGEPGYTSSVRRTQSPTSDIQFEDYFPPLEMEEEGEERAEGNYHEGSDAGLRPSRVRVDSDTELLSSTSSFRGSSQKDHSLSRGKERSWQRLLHLPTVPALYRNILKCSLAYLLGSLFTYYTPLARFISELTQDSPGEKYPSVMGHMVATV